MLEWIAKKVKACGSNHLMERHRYSYNSREAPTVCNHCVNCGRTGLSYPVSITEWRDAKDDSIGVKRRGESFWEGFSTSLD